jgi:undecaprenyl-diphosphatase
MESSFVFYINQFHYSRIDGIINFISDLSTPLLIINALLALVLGYRNQNKQQKSMGIFLIVAFSINALSTTLLKHFTERIRPFHVNEMIDKLGSGGSFSFPSGHSADAILLGMVVLHFYQETSIKVFAIAWMILIPLTRIYLGVHYFTDIIGSFILATISIEFAKKIVSKISL